MSGYTRKNPCRRKNHLMSTWNTWNTGTAGRIAATAGESDRSRHRRCGRRGHLKSLDPQWALCLRARLNRSQSRFRCCANSCRDGRGVECSERGVTTDDRRRSARAPVLLSTRLGRSERILNCHFIAGVISKAKLTSSSA